MPSSEVMPERVEVPRWIQLVLLPLAILGAWALVRASGSVALIFIIAGLIALLLNPFVAMLRRARFPRGLAVLTVYVGLLVCMGGIGVLLANPVADQVSAFQDNVPEIIDDANASLDDVQRWLDDNGIDLQVKDPGRSALSTIGDNLAQGSGEVVSFTRDALRQLVEVGFAFILVIVLSVYMLLYGERIGAGVRSVLPRGDGTPEDDFPTALQRAVFGYVRGQLLFSTIMGTSAGLMLYVVGSLGIFEQGKEYALFFGAWFGFAELIPYVGPTIGALPPVLIALLGADALDGVWLAVFFAVLQQIEGHVVAPNVFAQALRINPILVIAALLLGGRLYGFVGAFVALPVAAVLRETVVYARRHYVLEPWNGPSTPALAGVGVSSEAPPPAPAEPAERCPECGAPRRASADTCPACGTELGSADEAAAATSSAPG
jgi:predicted PurR-regulated permease PerM